MMKNISKLKSVAIIITLLAVLGACASNEKLTISQNGKLGTTKTILTTKSYSESVQREDDLGEIATAENSVKQKVEFETIHKGNGRFIKQPKAIFGKRKKVKDGITLNFEKADIATVVNMILADILKVNYFFDPSIRGTVTLNTSKPVHIKAVLPILEGILKNINAKLVITDDFYQIVPIKNSITAGIRVGKGFNRSGVATHIIPLKYISATQMLDILKPVSGSEHTITMDQERNILILQGDSQRLSNILDMVDTFDVDWLSGRSIGQMKIQYANVNAIAKELELIFSVKGENAPLAGLIRFVPFERTNTLMVITAQEEYLNKVKYWIERLDIPDTGMSQQLFVYHVDNSNAEDLAKTLNSLFETSGESLDQQDSNLLAPGLTPFKSGTANFNKKLADSTSKNQSLQTNKSKPEQHTDKKDSTMQTTATTRPVRIIAAKDNNLLLIYANPAEYVKIQAAIKQLDVMPLQVLVEASIIDVRLSDEFSMGMQWFFNNRSGGYSGEGQSGGALSFSPTFNYNIVNSTNELRNLIGLLASEGKVNVLSSPSLMVRNNQKANIRVGDQQPISTALVSPEGRVIASSVQFKDTGVILEVTPRVNSSGLVTLDVNQEVTDVGDIDEATGQRAFLHRSIQSTVAVNTGETIVLGGLIRENKVEGMSGVPVLSRLPFIGWLFGKTTTSTIRTELIIMLTPRIVRNQLELRQVTSDYRNKLSNIKPIMLEKANGLSKEM